MSQALISVESLSQEDVEESIEKLREGKFVFEIINEKEQLLDLFFWDDRQHLNYPNKEWFVLYLFCTELFMQILVEKR